MYNQDAENSQSTKPPDEQEEIQKAISKIAEKKPEELIEFIAMEMGAIGNPLYTKMTPEHISKILEIAAKYDDHQYDLNRQAQINEISENKSNKAYYFAGFIVIILLTITILIIYRNQPQVLIPILTGLGGLFSGFLGGWGWGKQRK
jgi:predicted RND superfamily exporter protein